MCSFHNGEWRAVMSGDVVMDATCQAAPARQRRGARSWRGSNSFGAQE